MNTQNLRLGPQFADFQPTGLCRSDSHEAVSVGMTNPFHMWKPVGRSKPDLFVTQIQASLQALELLPIMATDVVTGETSPHNKSGG